MKILFLLIIAWVMFGCSEESSTAIHTEPEEETVESLPEIKGTLFELALREDLNDPCTFLLECDCCVGDLLLREDGTFYHLEYCVNERQLFSGTYVIQGNALSVNYDGLMATEILLLKDSDQEETASYEVKEIEPQTTQFSVRLCEEKLRLDDESKTFVGLQVLHEGGKLLFGTIDTDPLVRFLKTEQRKR
jgi:hypothetical protein